MAICLNNLSIFFLFFTGPTKISLDLAPSQWPDSQRESLFYWAYFGTNSVYIIVVRKNKWKPLDGLRTTRRSGAQHGNLPTALCPLADEPRLQSDAPNQRQMLKTIRDSIKLPSLTQALVICYFRGQIWGTMLSKILDLPYLLMV